MNHELHHLTQLGMFGAIKKILTEKHSSASQKYILNEGFSRWANIPSGIMRDCGNLLQKMKISKIGNKLAKKSYNIYSNELIEKQARLAGQKAKNDYIRTCDSLENIFTGVPSNHFTEEYIPTVAQVGIFN